MDNLKRKSGKPQLLIFLTKLILFYLFFSSCPSYSGKRTNDRNVLSDKNYTYISTIKENNLLKEKLILDLSKNEILDLIDKDLLVNVSLDVEGKVIGYKPSIISMPSYWNSEVTKKILVKNNLFSMSYRGDQVISFKISSLLG
jgi:hypothetical protein|tara:strand:+ start:123 stop:551 length:429 start_codon:yes stop_codon:yes gene_type:complete